MRTGVSGNLRLDVDTVILDRVRVGRGEALRKKGLPKEAKEKKTVGRAGERENVARRMAGVQLKELRPIK